MNRYITTAGPTGKVIDWPSTATAHNTAALCWNPPGNTRTDRESNRTHRHEAEPRGNSDRRSGDKERFVAGVVLHRSYCRDTRKGFACPFAHWSVRSFVYSSSNNNNNETKKNKKKKKKSLPSFIVNNSYNSHASLPNPSVRSLARFHRVSQPSSGCFLICRNTNGISSSLEKTT